MPRNVDDGCIFCAPDPCTCRAKPKKAAPIKATAKRSEPKAAAQPRDPSVTGGPHTQATAPPLSKCSRPDCPGDCKNWEQCVAPVQKKRAGLSAVKRQPAIPRPVIRVVPVVERSLDPEEAEMRRAVTCIADAGLLGEAEMNKHRKLIDLPDARIRALVWRQKHGRP